MSIGIDLAINSDAVSCARRVVWQHRWYIAILTGFCGFVTLVSALESRTTSFSLSLYTGPVMLLTLLFCFGFLLLHPVYVMLFRRPKRLIATIWADWTENYLSVERLVSAALVLVFLPPFISAFTTFKSLIPVIQPFAWDPTFAAADRWLHGGVDAWLLLQPWAGEPAITTAINFVYHLWLFVLYGVLFWQAFCLRDPELRLQFLIAFLLSWVVIGSFAAVVLSSAGPVYYGRVTGLEDPYRELMLYLQAAREVSPVWALNVQDMLWEGYTTGGNGIGQGISAMPSMHVGIAALLAFLGWKVGRLPGIALTFFAVTIQIGAVHLGWHYAIDGYVAAGLAWIIWRISGDLAEASV